MTEPGAPGSGPIAPPPPPSFAPPPPPPPVARPGPFPGAPGFAPAAPGVAPAAVPVTYPVSDEVRSIPLGTRKLVGRSLDLLTRPDSGLRAASFYIGFLVLLTIGPLVMLGGVALTLDGALFDPDGGTGFDAALLLASMLAIAGYVVAGVEARALATAVIGARAEGRPLRLREAIGLTRRRFWHVLGANVVVGIIAGLLTLALQVPLGLALGNVEAINYGLSLVIGTIVGAPFAYVAAGIVLGEADATTAISRSFGLARARPRLALVVAMFSILSQFIVLFGIGIGGDLVLRVLDGTGIGESFPAALAVPVAAALTFAFGTLLFLVESITAAPAVHAFLALTHYARGLQAGRDAPAPGTSIWSPWMTPGLAIGAAIGLLAIVLGLSGLP